MALGKYALCFVIIVVFRYKTKLPSTSAIPPCIATSSWLDQQVMHSQADAMPSDHHSNQQQFSGSFAQMLLCQPLLNDGFRL